jgi:hypothetical protein
VIIDSISQGMVRYNDFEFVVARACPMYCHKWAYFNTGHLSDGPSNNDTDSENGRFSAIRQGHAEDGLPQVVMLEVVGNGVRELLRLCKCPIDM